MRCKIDANNIFLDHYSPIFSSSNMLQKIKKERLRYNVLINRFKLRCFICLNNSFTSPQDTMLASVNSFIIFSEVLFYMPMSFLYRKDQLNHFHTVFLNPAMLLTSIFQYDNNLCKIADTHLL